MSLKPKAVIAAVILLALGLGACSSGDAEHPVGDSVTSAPSGSTSSSPSNTTSSTPSTEAPDVVGEWLVRHLASDDAGGLTNVWTDAELTLVLKADGTLSGHAGCNDFSGRYEMAGEYVSETGFDTDLGQTMEITELSWTEKACDGELLMLQESEFLTDLGRVDHWYFDADFDGDLGLLELISLEDGLQVGAVPKG